MYPTTKALQEKIKYARPNKHAITIIHIWKNLHYLKKWKKKTKKEKQISIEYLNSLLSLIFHKPNNQIGIEWQEYAWVYEPTERIIWAEANNPSIISLLHEFGHSIYGSSELKACVFSIALFKTCFPKEYTRLEWNEHMLIRK